MCCVVVSVVCIYFKYLRCVCVWGQCVCGLYLFQIYEVFVCGVCVYLICIHLRYLRALCLLYLFLCSIFINICEVCVCAVSLVCIYIRYLRSGCVVSECLRPVSISDI